MKTLIETVKNILLPQFVPSTFVMARNLGPGDLIHCSFCFEDSACPDTNYRVLNCTKSEDPNHKSKRNFKKKFVSLQIESLRDGSVKEMKVCPLSVFRTNHVAK